MASRISQRTVYVLTAVIVASMVGGFAVASMTLGGVTNTSYQGSQTTTVSPVPGLTWASTDVAIVPGAAAVSNGCTVLGAPCDLSPHGFEVCAGSFSASMCNPSDFIEKVTISVDNLVNIPTGVVMLTVYVTGTPVGLTAATFVGPTSYFTETTGHPAAPESITLDFDIGSSSAGPGAVTSVSVLATTSP